jgi:hypothetical protein
MRTSQRRRSKKFALDYARWHHEERVQHQVNATKEDREEYDA